MDNPEIEGPELPEPANLKFLRRLVTTLTAVMIVGVVVMITLVVIRLQQPPAPIALPDVITLPDGSVAQSFTQARDWYAVVTQTNQILIYNRATGTLTQTIDVK